MPEIQPNEKWCFDIREDGFGAFLEHVTVGPERLGRPSKTDAFFDPDEDAWMLMVDADELPKGKLWIRPVLASLGEKKECPSCRKVTSAYFEEARHG